MKSMRSLLIAVICGLALPIFAQVGGATFFPLQSMDPRQKNPVFQPIEGTRGAAAGLRITACETTGYTNDNKFDFMGSGVQIFVDVIDAQGNVVNDLVLDDGIEILIERNESGSTADSSYFVDEYLPEESYILDAKEGLEKELANLEAESVTLIAKSDGLADSAPVTIVFENGGKITGNLIVPVGCPAQQLFLTAQHTTDDDFSKTAFLQVVMNGIPIPYSFSGLKPGNYVITLYATHGTGAGPHVRALCEDNSPLTGTVTAGGTTDLGTHTLATLAPGGIQGTVTLEGRANLLGTRVNITVIPQGNECVSMMDQSMTLNNANVIPSNNDP